MSSIVSVKSYTSSRSVCHVSFVAEPRGTALRYFIRLKVCLLFRISKRFLSPSRYLDSRAFRRGFSHGRRRGIGLPVSCVGCASCVWCHAGPVCRKCRLRSSVSCSLVSGCRQGALGHPLRFVPVACISPSRSGGTSVVGPLRTCSPSHPPSGPCFLICCAHSRTVGVSAAGTLNLRLLAPICVPARSLLSRHFSADLL